MQLYTQGPIGPCQKGTVSASFETPRQISHIPVVAPRGGRQEAETPLDPLSQLDCAVRLRIAREYPLGPRLNLGFEISNALRVSGTTRLRNAEIHSTGGYRNHANSSPLQHQHANHYLAGSK